MERRGCANDREAGDQEYMRQHTARPEPAYKTELQEERRRREQLEKRLNEMGGEQESAGEAANSERGAIRAELQRLGVVKSIWLTGRCRRIVRTEDGRLLRARRYGKPMKRIPNGICTARILEFLPARISGGTGMTGTQGSAGHGGWIWTRSARHEQGRAGAGAEGNSTGRVAALR